MLFFEDRAMESMETLVHPHAPRNGARRGSDTHSFLLKVVRAPLEGMNMDVTENRVQTNTFAVI